ncbi:MAG: hypothetical protein LWW97_00420 [Deltaproteobacteria bacterium]|nr:hypothetical protein [Deltaproteobacteria bacterium]
MKQKWFNKNPKKTLLISNILGLTVLILFSEILVRIFVPEIIPIGVSKNLFRYNVYGDTFANSKSTEAIAVGKKIYTDNNGFRIDPHTDYGYKKDKRSLFFVGDSMTFGYGVSAEKTFVEFINRNSPDYKIVNAAVLGYNLHDYRNFIDYYIIKNKAVENSSYVVMSLCLNDFNLDLLPKSDILRHQSQYTTKDVFLINKLKSIHIFFALNNFLRRTSRLYLFLKSLFEDTSARYFITDARLHNPDKKNYQEGLEILRYISEILSENRIKFKVILFPYEYQLRTNDHLTPQENLKNFFSQYHIEYIDLYDYLLNHIRDNKIEANKLFLYNDSTHFSEFGHQVISKYLLNNL